MKKVGWILSPCEALKISLLNYFFPLQKKHNKISKPPSTSSAVIKPSAFAFLKAFHGEVVFVVMAGEGELFPCHWVMSSQICQACFLQIESCCLLKSVSIKCVSIHNKYILIAVDFANFGNFWESRNKKAIPHDYAAPPEMMNPESSRYSTALGMT